MLKIHSFLREVKVGRINFFSTLQKKRNSIAAPIIYIIVAALLVFNFSYFSGFNQKASQLHAKAESIMNLLEEVEETNTSALFTTDIKQYTFSNLNLNKNKSIIDDNKMSELLLAQTLSVKTIQLFPLGQLVVSLSNKANRNLLFAPQFAIDNDTAEVNQKDYTKVQNLNGQNIMGNGDIQLMSLEVNPSNTSVYTSAQQTKESVLPAPEQEQDMYGALQEEKFSLIQQDQKNQQVENEAETATKGTTEKTLSVNESNSETQEGKQKETQQKETQQKETQQVSKTAGENSAKKDTSTTKQEKANSEDNKKQSAGQKAKTAQISEKAVEAAASKGLVLTQNTSMVKSLSSEELEILQRIVEAEATGEDIYGKIIVANVVLNRVNDNKFPNTVKGVVFQKSGSTYQFSPIKDGRFWSVKISSSTKKAVNKALSGEDYSQGACYFFARKLTTSSKAKWFDNSLDRLFKYGCHEFYK